jgi:hypothetical protein
VALGVLLAGKSEQSPSPIRWAPLVVKLVTHSKLPMANSYSSRGRPTGLEGLLPPFEEYHESDVHQDSNMGPESPRRPRARVLATSVPILHHP